MKSLIISITRWLIDSEGSSYGDERERLKYYEAHSAWINLQSLLLPSLGALLIALSPDAALLPILILTYLPTVLSFFPYVYLRHEKVNLFQNARKSRKWTLINFTLMLPLYVTLLYKITLTHYWRTKVSSDQLSFWVGTVAGIFGVYVFFMRLYLKEKKENS